MLTITAQEIHSFVMHKHPGLFPLYVFNRLKKAGAPVKLSEKSLKFGIVTSEMIEFKGTVVKKDYDITYFWHIAPINLN